MPETYTIPEEYKPVHDLAFSFVDQVRSDLETQFDLESSEPGEIANEPRPGFFPFTQGGWMSQPSSYLSAAQGSGRHAGLVSGAIEDAEEQAAEAWHEDGKPMLGGSGWDDDYREQWHEHEREWLEQFYMFDVRAAYYAADNSRNQSGYNEVQFVVMVNFDEYGRDGEGVKLWEQNVLAGIIDQAKIDELIKEATEQACKVEAIAEPGK